eukprot:1156674-Pelagomonas_calceolata.AAC.2
MCVLYFTWVLEQLTRCQHGPHHSSWAQPGYVVRSAEDIQRAYDAAVGPPQKGALAPPHTVPPGHPAAAAAPPSVPSNYPTTNAGDDKAGSLACHDGVGRRRNQCLKVEEYLGCKGLQRVGLQPKNLADWLLVPSAPVATNEEDEVFAALSRRLENLKSG